MTLSENLQLVRYAAYISLIVTLVFGILLIWRLSKILKFRRNNLKTAAAVITTSTTATILLISFDQIFPQIRELSNLLVLSITQITLTTTYLLIIKTLYKEDWKKTLTLGLLSTITLELFFILLTITLTILYMSNLKPH